MSGALADEEDGVARVAALSALGRWHAEKPWARVDPRTLALEEVHAVGPTQVILGSLYERRGVRYELRAARGRPERPEVGPDPWSVRLEHPQGARLGHEVRTRLANATLHMDCVLCQTTGQMTCVRCGGTGTTQEGGSSQACFACSGRGYLRCDTCDGAGGVLGEPTIWSVLGRHREVRTLEDGSLPMDVFFALHDGASGRDTEGDGGVLIHVQEGERVHGLQRAQGYRDDAVRGARSALHRAVEKLGAAPGMEATDRILHQRLEVRQVPVYALVLRGGDSVFVYGDPLQLSAPDALLTRLGKVAHTFGWS